MFTLLALLQPVAAAFPPTPVTLPPDAATVAAVVAALERQAGLKLSLSGLDPAAPVRRPAGPVTFWEAVDGLGGRVRVGPHGKLLLAAGPPAPAARDGAFRLAVREVTCRWSLDDPGPGCEVGLTLHWEPRLVVVRAAADRVTAKPLAASAGGGKAAVSGGSHSLSVRLDGVTRAVAVLPPLDVGFTVTAADHWLTFTVPDLRDPKPQTQAGVTLAPKPARPLDTVVEFRLDLLYPDGHPEFESFESWTANNRCRLVHPDGRTLDPGDNADESHRGRTASLAYRFPAAAVGDPAGWSLALDTPGPLREFPVRFRLADVPLP